MQDQSYSLIYPERSYTTNYHPTAAQLFIRMGSLNKLQSLAARNVIALPQALDLNTGLFFFDMVITQVVDRCLEFEKITPYIGNHFSHTFMGKAPVSVGVTGVLLENRQFGSTAQQYSTRSDFTLAYGELFRLTRVSRHHIAPTLAFNDAFLTGAFIDLNLAESSADENQIAMSFSFLILEAFYRSPDSQGFTNTLSVNYSDMSRFVDTTFN